MYGEKAMENFIKNRNSDLADGRQIDISEYGQQSGMPLPLYTTSGVWETHIVPDEEAVKKGETDIKRLGKIINQLIYLIRVYRQDNRSNVFGFEVDLTYKGVSQSIKLISYLGRKSDEDGNPSITILLPDELESVSNNEQAQQ